MGIRKFKYTGNPLPKQKIIKGAICIKDFHKMNYTLAKD